jgi:hypothetical protein
VANSFHIQASFPQRWQGAPYHGARLKSVCQCRPISPLGLSGSSISPQSSQSTRAQGAAGT